MNSVLDWFEFRGIELEANLALIDLSRVRDAIRDLVAAAEEETTAFGDASNPFRPADTGAMLESRQHEAEARHKLVAAMQVFERRLPALQRAVLSRAVIGRNGGASGAFTGPGKLPEVSSVSPHNPQYAIEELRDAIAAQRIIVGKLQRNPNLGVGHVIAGAITDHALERLTVAADVIIRRLELTIP